ncbi:MAG TPA: hypothetical protein VGR06_40940 [Actinophytocola sp.]|uniref:hypothetical protein n=1 Tax=Actinophytocola sp. TaxID=1872138 RepID=UPI002DF8CC52|nr:hypothetical protein [Actinophytocola sp.]
MLKRVVSVHDVAFGEVELGGRQVEVRYRQPKVAEIGPLPVGAHVAEVPVHMQQPRYPGLSRSWIWAVVLALDCVPAALLPAVRLLGS